MKDEQAYIRAYIETIKTPPSNTKKLFAIGFVGLNGSGKSTVALHLASRLNLFVASNARIRRWLNEQGYHGDSPEQEFMQRIAEASSRYLYAKRISHIIDNDLRRFHPTAREIADHSDACLFLIHVVAPEKIVLDRLIRRTTGTGDLQDLSRAGVDEYQQRKVLHATLPMPEVLLRIDTSEELEPQLNMVVRELRTLGFVA